MVKVTEEFCCIPCRSECKCTCRQWW